jgi:hypothetical protein
MSPRADTQSINHDVALELGDIQGTQFFVIARISFMACTCCIAWIMSLPPRPR